MNLCAVGGAEGEGAGSLEEACETGEPHPVLAPAVGSPGHAKLVRLCRAGAPCTDQILPFIKKGDPVNQDTFDALATIREGNCHIKRGQCHVNHATAPLN